MRLRRLDFSPLVLFVVFALSATSAFAAPSITSVSLQQGASGTPVTLGGLRFGATQGSSTVTFRNVVATPTSWSDTQIVVPVPSAAPTGANFIYVTTSAGGSNGTFFNVTTPSITSLSPTSGSVGRSVTIAGTNFGTTQGTSTLKFNGTAASVTAWSASSITAAVPSGATTGNVVVTVGSASSTGVNFTVIVPPTIAASVFPPPNASGWNTTNVYVTFTCTAGSLPIATCPAQQVVSTDGANQIFTGTATDNSGNSASVSVTLNVERTPPALAVSAPVDQAVSTSATLSVSGTASNSVTTVNSVTCNGASAATSAGAFSCNLSLNPGVNLVMIRATDVAGNISAVRLHVSYAAALPAPASLQIGPATANVLVGGTQQFSAVDELGRPRTDATWTVDNSSVATITTDPSPTLTGVAAGTVTVTANVSGISAQIQVNILAGTSLPAGTLLWSAPSTPGFTVQQIAQAVPTQGGPDLYSVEAGSNNSLVRALTSDGQVLWQSQIAAAYGGKSVPDGAGGLLLKLAFGSGTNSIVDLDAQTGAQVWRYDDPATSNAIAAVGQDGTTYLTDLASSPGPQPTFELVNFDTQTLIGLDPITGLPRLAYTGPQSTIAVSYACNRPIVKQAWNAGPFANITIGTDGTLYGEVPMSTITGTNSCTGPDTDPHFYDINSFTQTLYLLQIPPGGSPSLTPIHTDSSLVGGFTGYSVIPDGQGGVLAPWSHGKFNGNPGDNHVTRINGSSQTDFSLPIQPLNLVLGSTGTAYATDSLEVVGFGASSGQIQWTYQVPDQGNDYAQIAAATDGGGVAIKVTDFGTALDTIFNLDSSGSPASILTTARTPNTATLPSYSWKGHWNAYSTLASGFGAAEIALPTIADPASVWGTNAGGPSGNEGTGALCDCLTETTDPEPPPPPTTCPICTLAPSTLPPSQPSSCTSTTGTLSTYLLLVGDSSTDPQGHSNVGNLFNLAAQTQANSLQAQGHRVIACRVSTIQQFNQALTGNGLIDGGLVYFGHAGRLPRTDILPDIVLYSLVSVGQGTDANANISYLNVSSLSNAQLAPNITITLNSCNAGKSWSPGQPAIALLIANQLKRDVKAYQVGMYFSQNPNDTHLAGIGKMPNSLPMYMFPQGAVPKPNPTLFIGH